MANSRAGESVLSRVVRIFETFAPDTPALRVTDIARKAGLPVPTASRLVEELVGHGWLHREPDRSVRLGLRMWELASRASPALSLREAAMPFMEDLQAVVGHHTQLGVLEGREVLFVERLSSAGAVDNVIRIAGRLPLHVNSAGLVLLAHAPVELQEEVLAAPLRAYTRRTITDPGRLRAFLAEVRRTGFSLSRGFIDDAVTGVGVPVRGPGGEVVAALAVIVPDDNEVPGRLPALQAAARGISRAIGHQPASSEPLSH
ncbi:DNA-binding IclR family transcriptional regulator [Crossiella equi]|uniref:DNA-binding IclR family transcriptional regulator n=1 Tax=Crossiella equi TaxID=130796 RepID=A0ABS5A529_9PSEU|nr:IclR family transcriptional regulator [Crossiella equi]MBP2471693.1 DNA-binding IclR family transcriptional regulator [Crossiella equi]